MSFWARLISIQADKQDIHFSNDCKEYPFDNEWEIFQTSAGDTLIKNLSASNLKIDDSLLQVNQEKKLLGGETLSFAQGKDRTLCYIFLSAASNHLKKNSAEKLLKAENDLQKEISCSICTETLYQCATLSPCSHSFCSSCLFDHLRKSSLCPLCRNEAKTVTKISTLCNLIQAVLNNFPALEKSKQQKAVIQEELLGNIVRNENGLYVGSLVDGKKDGQGKFGHPDGTVYEGSWKNDQREGDGVITWRNGGQYNGSWVNNCQHGKGKKTWSSGQEYKGDFMNGLRDGFGTIKFKNGDIYKGDWKNDKREGKGIYSFQKGDKYEGSWMNNFRHAMGKYTWKNGDEYEGNWTDNRKDGAGTVKYADGRIFKGEWKNDKKEGNGVLVLKNGDSYEGNWANDIIQPLMTATYANGSSYKGEIEEESLKKQGKGLFTSSNGDQYDGEWVGDKQNGKGKKTWKEDKWTFEGTWEDGKMKEGVMTYADGSQLKAEWKKIEEEGK